MAATFLRRTGCLAVAVAIGVLAGCGSSSPSGSSASEPAGKVLANVRSLGLAAKSVHISGSVKQGSTTVTLDMSFDGSDFFGTVQEGATTIDMQRLGGKVYVKLTSAFLKTADVPSSVAGTVCAKYCGHYVQLPASDAAQLTGKLSMGQLVNQAFSAKAVADAKQTNVEFVPATLDGRSVLQASQGGYTFDVTSGSAHYPVLWAAKGQRIEFSDWNSVTLPAPPPASDIISLSSLAGA
jgi:hypothetical protein